MRHEKDPHHPKVMGVLDLLLGSDIGLWVAQTARLDGIATVITEDPDIAAAAAARGAAVSSEPGGGWRALSVHYPRVLTADALGHYEAVYNLHPGYLPWGRGHFPLVWAIANCEPAGATLHRMTERVDAGPIIAQVQVEVGPADTAGELHQRIRDVERYLFLRWRGRLLRPEPIPERPQPPGGSYHDKAQFAALLATDPDTLEPEDLDRLRRATTFPGKPGLGATSRSGGNCRPR